MEAMKGSTPRSNRCGGELRRVVVSRCVASGKPTKSGGGPNFAYCRTLVEAEVLVCERCVRGRSSPSPAPGRAPDT